MSRKTTKKEFGQKRANKANILVLVIALKSKVAPPVCGFAHSDYKYSSKFHTTATEN